jgi:hypothetical protein
MTYRNDAVFVVEPERTIPSLAVTAGDVVALVAQQLEITGRRPALTDRSARAAHEAAGLLLTVLCSEGGDP